MARISWMQNGTGYWTTRADWSSGALPGLDDDVDIGQPKGDVVLYGVEANAIVVNSVSVSGGSHLSMGSDLFGAGAIRTTRGLTIATGSSLIMATEGGCIVSVGNILSNDGLADIGGDEQRAKVTAESILNGATGLFDIGNGTVTTSNFTNLAASATSNVAEGVYVDDLHGDESNGTLDVTGTLTNDGIMVFGQVGSTTKANLGTLNNKSTGAIDIDSASVTVANVDNSGHKVGSAPGGIGIDHDKGESGGSLTVTDAFTNTGDFAIGTAGSATTVSIGKLDNLSTGFVDVASGTVTVGELANSGVKVGLTPGGIAVDAGAGDGEAAIAVTGAFTNRGDFLIGNSGMAGPANVTVGTLDNTFGEVILDGSSTSQATLEIEQTSDVWHGVLILENDALMEMSDNGKIDTIALDGIIKISGGTSFLADADDETSNSALSDLTEVDGILSLQMGSASGENMGGATLTITGDLVNNRISSASGEIGVDTDSGSSGSSLTVDKELANNGDLEIGNTDSKDPTGKGSTTVTLGSFANAVGGSVSIIDSEMIVDGNLTNAGAGLHNGVSGGIAVGDVEGSKNGSLTVDGFLSNSGAIGIGFDGDGGGSATVGAANFINTGVVDINASSAKNEGFVEVTGTYTQGPGSPSVTNVDGTLHAGLIKLTGGAIDGTGLIVGDVDNVGGNIQAGASLSIPGILAIGTGSLPGSYTQGKKGRLTEPTIGVSTGQFGEIKVNGAVTLGGILDVDALENFNFAAGQTFEVMSFLKKKLKGTFAEIDDGAFSGNAHDVKIGGGLAIVAIYNNTGGAIDLDVVATTDSVATFKSKTSILNEIAGGFAISDTAAHVDADLAGLEADISNIASVTITGSGPQVLTITEAQKTSDAALLKKLRGSYTLKVVNGDASPLTGARSDLAVDGVARNQETIAEESAKETFVFKAGPRDDMISDFSTRVALANSGHDFISIPTSDLSNFSSGIYGPSNFSGNVVITGHHGETPTLTGHTRS